MADLLSFLPLIGKNPLFGNSLFGPPEAAPGPDAFAAPDPTTIAGMPALPLGTAAGLAGLFALLAKKGYARQAALQGGLLGYNIGNAPIQQEQQRYDQMIKSGLESGQLTTTAPAASDGKVPAPVTTQGGVPLYRPPQISIGQVFRGAGLDPALAGQQVPVSAGLLTAALANAKTEELKNYLVSQGLSSDTPPEIATAIINEKRRLESIPELLRLAGKPGPTQSQRVEIGPTGPQIVTETPSADQLRRQEATDIFNQTYRTNVLAGQTAETATRAAEAEIRKALIDKQMEELKTKPSGILAKRLDAARNQNATDLKLLGELYDEQIQQIRPGYEGLYNETLGRVRTSGQLVQQLTTALDAKLAEESGVTVEKTIETETPEQKSLNDQTKEYFNTFLGSARPEQVLTNIPRPKDPQKAAAYDKAARGWQEIVLPLVDEIKAHMQSRPWYKVGLNPQPDPDWANLMRQQNPQSFDAALKIWQRGG